MQWNVLFRKKRCKNVIIGDTRVKKSLWNMRDKIRDEGNGDYMEFIFGITENLGNLAPVFLIN